jgi:hypothetical protein
MDYQELRKAIADRVKKLRGTDETQEAKRHRELGLMLIALDNVLARRHKAAHAPGDGQV